MLADFGLAVISAFEYDGGRGARDPSRQPRLI